MAGLLLGKLDISSLNSNALTCVHIIFIINDKSNILDNSGCLNLTM